MAKGLADLIFDEMERGVDVHAFDAVTTGPPKPKRDRTVEAAPLNWTPPPEEQESPT